jgi:splicing factor 3A subunit 1
MKMQGITPSSGTGIIIPPQEIRQEIETTAKYVARHGRDFENKIIVKEKNNPIFSFINKDDPYRAYYDQKVGEGTE